MRVLLAVVGLVLVLPSAVAQAVVTKCSRECEPTDPDVNPDAPNVNAATRVILYAHVHDSSGSATMNTQRPNESGPRPKPGLPIRSMPVSNGDACARIVWQQSPGLVEFIENGWRTRQGAGLSADLNLKADGHVLYAYLRPSPDDSPGLVPAAKVEVTIAGGIQVGRGAVLATGVQELAPTSLPADHVLELRVPLVMRTPTWPLTETERGVHVVIRICELQAGSAQASALGWSVVQPLNTFNRIILNVYEPMAVDEVTFAARRGELYVRLATVVTFGNYDFRDDSVRLTGQSGDQQLDPSVIRMVNVRRSIDPDGAMLPVVTIWSIPLKALQHEREWTFTAQAANLQNTFVLQTEHAFSLVEFQGKPAPGVGAASFLALAALALAWSRRR